LCVDYTVTPFDNSFVLILARSTGIGAVRERHLMKNHDTHFNLKQSVVTPY